MMNQRPRFLPPIWLALILSFIGIVGMNLVYQSVTSGGLARGIMGTILLIIGVVSVGTPLAFARIVRKEQRAKEK